MNILKYNHSIECQGINWLFFYHKGMLVINFVIVIGWLWGLALVIV